MVTKTRIQQAKTKTKEKIEKEKVEKKMIPLSNGEEIKQKITDLPALAKKALIVRIRYSKFRGSKKDSLLAMEIANVYGADEALLSVTKKLLCEGELAPINKAEAQVKRIMKVYTVPWAEGEAMLPAHKYMDWKREIDEAIRAYNTVCDNWCTDWPEKVKRAIEAGGGLLKEEFYPDLKGIRKTFSIYCRARLMDCVDPKDPRFTLNDNEIQEITENTNKETLENIDKSINSIFHRDFKPYVERMIERLDSFHYDHKGNIQNGFHGSLVQNIRDVLHTVPMFNITQNPEIEEFCREIKTKLTQWDSDVLKESESARKETCAAAKVVLEKINKLETVNMEDFV